MPISVFKTEREDGVAELVRVYKSVALTAPVSFSEPFEVSLEKLSKATGTNLHQPDLRYLKSILVTAGWEMDPKRGVPCGMNINDDFFDPLETYAARHTPEDKPVNDNHDCAYIVGHITSNEVVKEDGTVLGEVDVDDVPENKFHVVTGSVLYTHWDKPDLQERMDKILAEVDAGKRAVSMECLFSGFDYVVVENGVAKAVARSAKTAFLTKHLRCYGGSGEYQGKRVGRLLRNMVFVGKGIVHSPANPESQILSVAEILHMPKELGYSQLTENHQTTESAIAMAQENKEELEAVKATNAGLVSEVEDLKAKLAEANAKAAEIAKVADAKLAEVTKAADAKLADAEKSLKAATDELNQIKADKKQTERIAKVKSALKLDDKEATEFNKTLAEMSDEKFEAHIQAISKFAPKQAQASVADLETVEVTPEPALAVETNAGAENVRKSIAAMFGYETEDENRA